MSKDILGYKGKRVVVMGCFSGTGEACARALVDLGAEVHGADIKPSPVDLASFTTVDLKDPHAIAAGIEKIGGKIDAVFNVSGLPQTFPGEDVVTVNFLGIRAWTEGWIPHLNPGAAIVSVSSLGGMKWLMRQPLLREFIAIEDFAERMPADYPLRTMRYANTRGVQREHPVWQALTHFFNHQTHHRGQVTVLLMQAGIDPGTTDLIAMI